MGDNRLSLISTRLCPESAQVIALTCWGVGWGVVAACSVFTLDTSGRGVKHGVGRVAAAPPMPIPPPPMVWVTGLWGSEVGVSSLWRPWESQLGDETWRRVFRWDF